MNLILVMLFTTAGIFCIGVVRAVSAGNMDSYIYIQTGAAEQKNVELLFEEGSEAPDSQAEEAEQRDVLNIPDKFLGKAVSYDMLNYFEASLETIYTQEKRTGYAKITVPDSTVYDFKDSRYIKEARDYRDAYGNNPCLDVHYQYGRALIDAGMELDSMLFSQKLVLMADAVYALEDLAAYKAWKAGEEGETVVIDECRIAFMIGKLYLHNASLAGGSEEGADYVNCFLVEAYVCFQQGRDQIDIRDRRCALVNYYIGEAGESLLARVDPEDEPLLYEEIRKTALDGYQEAKGRFAESPDYYQAEPRMEERIDKAIKTLSGLPLNPAPHGSPFG